MRAILFIASILATLTSTAFARVSSEHQPLCKADLTASRRKAGSRDSSLFGRLCISLGRCEIEYRSVGFQDRCGIVFVLDCSFKRM